jgi:hypothetical protein
MKNNKPIWFNKTGAVTEINIGTQQPKYHHICSNSCT